MKTYAITFGYDLMRGGKRITGTDFVHARSFEEAWTMAKGMCSRTEKVLYVDEYIKPNEVI
jgi:hypothetical protein